MLALALVLAQQTEPAPGWADIIGPYGALALSVVVIYWLARRLAESERARTEMTERLIAQQEKSIPLLERVAAGLERRERDR